MKQEKANKLTVPARKARLCATAASNRLLCSPVPPRMPALDDASNARRAKRNACPLMFVNMTQPR